MLNVLQPSCSTCHVRMFASERGIYKRFADSAAFRGISLWILRVKYTKRIPACFQNWVDHPDTRLQIKGSCSTPLIHFDHAWLMPDAVRIASGFPYPFSKACWNHRPIIQQCTKSVCTTLLWSGRLFYQICKWFHEITHGKMLIQMEKFL